jgi:hypothetical protein
LRIRKELGLYANIRPANFASESLLDYSPLKPEIARGFDMIVVRELIGGLCECPSYRRASGDPPIILSTVGPRFGTMTSRRPDIHSMYRTGKGRGGTYPMQPLVCDLQGLAMSSFRKGKGVQLL